MYNSLKLAAHTNILLYWAICTLSLLFCPFFPSLKSLLEEMKEEDRRNKKVEKIKTKEGKRPERTIVLDESAGNY
jgi:hypothetical protein